MQQRISLFFLSMTLFLALHANLHAKVGSLDSNFSVTSQGQAGYSVDLPTLPAGNGLGFNLKASYHSQAKSGYLGLGWNLNGFDVIRRCNATKAIEGQNHTPDFSPKDRYCLNSQKLILVDGTYGADQSVYRTFRDSFAKIVAQGQTAQGPSWFKVYLKNGEIHEFGHTDDSHLLVDGKGIARWALNRITDRFGNEVLIRYARGDEGREFLPELVQYGGGKDVPHYRKVQFAYEERNSKILGYQHGVANILVRRLKSITVSNIQSSRVDQDTWTYHFKYDETSMRDVLREIQHCNYCDECLPPTKFEYHQSGLTSLTVKDSTTDFHDAWNWTGKNSARIVVDLDADGFNDLIGLVSDRDNQFFVALGSPNGFQPTETHKHKILEGWDPDKTPINIIDVNGDSYADIVGFFDAKLRILYGSPEGFKNAGREGAFKEINLESYDVDWWNARFYPRNFSDLNGDSLADIILFADDGVYVAYNDGQGFTAFNRRTTSFDKNYRVKNHPRMVIDHNYDGYADIFGFHDHGVHLSQGFYQGLTDSQEVSGHFGAKDKWYMKTNPRSIRDVNGDGLADIVGFSDEGVDVALATSYGEFMAARQWLKKLGAIENDWNETTESRYVVDLNDDGYGDFVAVDRNADIHVYFGTGQPMLGKVEPDAVFSFGDNWHKKNEPISWTDVNGDGIPDLVILSNDKTIVLINKTSKMLLERATNGLGRQVEFEYEPLTNSAVYQKYDDASFPLNDISGSSQVVAKVKASDGLGGFKTVSYRYEGGRYHRQGFGFLGFSKKIIQDHDTKKTTTKLFSQDYENLTFGALLEENLTLDGKTIFQKKNSWASLKKGGIESPWFQVFTDVSSIKNFDPDGSEISSSSTSSTFDSFGNIVSSESIINDQFGTYTSVTTNRYEQDDPSKWLLGRLTHAQVKSVQQVGVRTKTQIKTSAFEYDGLTGALRKEVVEPGTKYQSTTEYLERNSFGQVQTKKTSWTKTVEDGLDFNEVKNEIRYDARGFPKRIVDARGNSSSLAVHPLFGVVVETKDANGLSSSVKYDGWAKARREIGPDGIETKTDYRLCSSSISSNCPETAVFYEITERQGSPVSKTYVDQLLRTVRSEMIGFDGKSIFVDQTYNKLGLLHKKSRPYIKGETPYWQTHLYDELGRIDKVTNPDGAEESYRYDGLNITVTDPRQKTTKVTRNALGQKILIENHLKELTKYEYTASGQLEKTDHAGHIVESRYNVLGQLEYQKDPNLGEINRVMNPLGLTYSVRHNDLEVLHTYDELGRLTSRHATGEDPSTFIYDESSHGIGKLSRQSRGDYTEDFIYDEKGRLSGVDYNVSGEAFKVVQTYDELGRAETLTYPSGFSTKNKYNSHGYLESVLEGESLRPLWTIHEQNSDGSPKLLRYGNGLSERIVHEKLTGRIERITAWAGSQEAVHDLGFSYDKAGNLDSRTDHFNGLQEDFTYDSLNRLETYSHAGKVNSVQYDSFGNIEFRSDLGTYHYGEACNGVTAGPQAVTSIVGEGAPRSYCYDKFGRAVDLNGTKIWYGSFQKPKRLKKGDIQAVFVYGPDGKRIFREDFGSEGHVKTTYIGSIFEKTVHPSSGVIKFRHFIGDKAYVIHEQGNENLKPATYYLHKDHLGSVVTVSDDKGKAAQRYSYDPWGKRLKEQGLGETPLSELSTRGFTGHEHISSLDLIHMNGRVYDPNIGRFISPDPIIQNPFNLQSLNRYSYVWNNPLSNVDPSGYISLKGIASGYGKLFTEIGRGISGAGKRLNKWVNNNGNQTAALAFTFAATIAAGPIGVASWGAWGYAYWGAVGFTSSFISSGGDLEAASKGAVIAMAFHGVGSFFESYGTAISEAYGAYADEALKTLAHGIVGGASSVAMGGDFESGFFSAAIPELFESFASNGVLEFLGTAKNSSISELARATVVGAIAGGLASEMTGGTFESGATTASYGRLFNAIAHLVLVAAFIGGMMNSQEIGKEESLFEVVVFGAMEGVDTVTGNKNQIRKIVAKKSESLKVLVPGSKEWKKAVEAIKQLGKGKLDFRVKTATDAKKLLKEARGNMDRRKNYTNKGRKWYEVHNVQNDRELEVGNDLRHLKWKDEKSGGHVFYDWAK